MIFVVCQAVIVLGSKGRVDRKEIEGVNYTCLVSKKSLYFLLCSILLF